MRSGVNAGEIATTLTIVFDFGGVVVSLRLMFGVGWGKAPSVQASGDPVQLKLSVLSEKFIAVLGQLVTVMAWLTEARLQALADTVERVDDGEDMAGGGGVLSADACRG